MLKKLIATKAHNAEQGPKIRRFDVAAAKLNTDPRSHPFVNGLTVLDRFKVRMRVFIQMRNADERASGVVYQFLEIEHLLEKISRKWR